MRAVLERDWLASVVGGRATLLRTVVAATVGAVVLAVAVEFFSDGVPAMGADRAGRAVFAGGALSLLGALYLVVPPIVAGSILLERQRGTLPLVLATPIGPARFALAKLLARSGAALFVFAAALPPVAVATLFGGVSGADILQAALGAVAVAVECAAWALWVSCRSQRLTTAVVLAYLVPAARWVVCLVPLGAVVLVQELGWMPSAPAEPGPAECALALAAPFHLVGTIVDPRWTTEAVRELSRLDGTGVLAFLAGHAALLPLAASALVAALAVSRCGVLLAREGEPPPSAADRSAAARRILRRPPVTGNPVAWKEAHLVNAAAARPLYYAVLTLMGLTEIGFLFAIHGGEIRGREIGDGSLVMVACEAGLVALVAAVVGAATLAHEKALGTLDLLRASPLTAGGFVAGKVAGILRGMGMLLVFPLAHLALVLLLGDLSFPGAAVAATAAVLLPATWAAVGLAVGGRSLALRGSILRAVGLYGIFLAGLPLVGALVAWIFRHGEFAETVVMALVMACPPVAALAGSLGAHHAATDRFRGNEFPRVAAAGVAWLLLHAAALAWISARLPGWIAARFDREAEEG